MRLIVFTDALALLRRVSISCGILLVLMVSLRPTTAFAHATLLRSDPGRDAILSLAPQRITMWFTEDLTPSLSTAAVLNVSGQRVDQRDATVSASDARAMALTLTPGLQPGPYLVLYRTHSMADGHFYRGSFLFSIAQADGTVPSSGAIIAPPIDPLGGTASVNPLLAGLDVPGLVSFLMISLVELGSVFWIGASLWLLFVPRSRKEDTDEVFEQARHLRGKPALRLSLILVSALLLANIGVLVGQALTLTGSGWQTAFSPTLLSTLATSSRFGRFWVVREATLLLALVFTLIGLLLRNRHPFLTQILLKANAILGGCLLLALVFSSHASAVEARVLGSVLVADGLHLLAAALWIGGMFTIALLYLPSLQSYTASAQAHALLTILLRYSPLAISGVALMLMTGPISAVVRFVSWEQVGTTTYGQTLLIKIALVGCLLCISALHVFLVRPRLRKELDKYTYALARQEYTQSLIKTELIHSTPVEGAVPSSAERRVKAQVKRREQRVRAHLRRLTTLLRLEAVGGAMVLICVGFLNVSAGSLAFLPPPSSQTSLSTPFVATLHTTDQRFTLHLTITPNQFGINTFTVTVSDATTSKPVTEAGVDIRGTMLDMDMGSEVIELTGTGGHFTGTGTLAMAGRWEIVVLVRTPDRTLHQARVQCVVSA